MLQNDGFYKFGSETLDDFRTCVRKADSDMSFLWEDSDDPDLTRTKLLESASRFRLLQTTRANALHAGFAPSRDVITSVANDLYEFIETLCESKRLTPYLKALPAPEKPIVNRAGLIEDLARRLARAVDLGEKSSLLRSVYLVLPYVPEIEPEWLCRFDRASVAPRDDDVTYLVRTLADAHGIYLFRQRGDGAKGLPAVIRNNDPDAIPISVHFLKREFTKIPDQFSADVANANGRLSEGILDVPPDDFVLDLFTVGLTSVGILGDGKMLTAQQVWPFVAAALSSPGTPRPYWFMVHHCDEPDKLVTKLNNAARCGNAYLRQRVEEATTGIKCLRTGEEWPAESPAARELRLAWDKARERWQALPQALARNKEGPRSPSSTLKEKILRVIDSEITIGEALEWLIENEISGDNLVACRYWARTLSEAAHEYRDRAGLLAVLRSEELLTAWTAARKAMRLGDALQFGPQIP